MHPCGGRWRQSRPPTHPPLGLVAQATASTGPVRSRLLLRLSQRLARPAGSRLLSRGCSAGDTFLPAPLESLVLPHHRPAHSPSRLWQPPRGPSLLQAVPRRHELRRCSGLVRVSPQAAVLPAAGQNRKSTAPDTAAHEGRYCPIPSRAQTSQWLVRARLPWTRHWRRFGASPQGSAPVWWPRGMP